MRFYILDAAHNVVEAVDTLTWGRWMQAVGEGRIVARTELPLASVSTVFLGMAMGFRDGDRPLVFETMIFPDPRLQFGVGLAGRWCSWAEAEAGHDAAVRAALAAHSSDVAG